MNYQVIVEEEVVKDFLFNFLPECSQDETYYFCLFARSKYAKNADGSNKFPHIKTDKAQLKRFVATPDWALRKIKQLECPIGSYLTKDEETIPQEALALYVTPNPRNQRTALIKCMKRYLDIIECKGRGFNIATEALSAIQKSKSYTHVVDFDIDSKDVDLSKMNEILPSEAYRVLETRGGYHILVYPKLATPHNKLWHPQITAQFKPDQSGDQMIPVPGTHQGGFIPKLL